MYDKMLYNKSDGMDDISDSAVFLQIPTRLFSFKAFIFFHLGNLSDNRNNNALCFIWTYIFCRKYFNFQPTRPKDSTTSHLYVLLKSSVYIELDDYYYFNYDAQHHIIIIIIIKILFILLFIIMDDDFLFYYIFSRIKKNKI